MSRDDLHEVFELATSSEVIDRTLSDALTALQAVIPYDLATVMQIVDDELRVRVAAGPLDQDVVRSHALQLSEHPSLQEVLESGRARAFHDEDHDHSGDPFDGVLDLPHGHYCMVSPLRIEDESLGIITLDRETCGTYSPDLVRLADVYGKLLALVLKYGEQSGRLDSLRRQLEEQNRVLRAKTAPADPGAMLEASRSPAMRHAVGLARQVAPTDAPVLIQGETGTGKEVLATALHGWSKRADGPMVSINCAALPAGLIESELFGHVKGAFSGATRSRIGRFQAADGGTFFLDEVGELPLELQAKLLRVLQDGSFQPVGSDKTVTVNVRILAATNRDLREEVEAGAFREDLYYRLAVFPVSLPPLRARREDIETIARSVLADLARRTGRGPWLLSDRDLTLLEGRDWPGNVRELVNTLERATILANGPVLRFEGETTSPRARRSAPFPTLSELERQHILAALDRSGGKVYGDGGAAELLGLHPNTLASRMKKHGLGGARDHR